MKEAIYLEEKKYTDDGYPIVSELAHCPLFERDGSAPRGGGTDCFFCKFSDFRKREYIERVESEARSGVLYSVCHNEKNKRDNTNSEKQPMEKELL